MDLNKKTVYLLVTTFPALRFFLTMKISAKSGGKGPEFKLTLSVRGTMFSLYSV